MAKPSTLPEWASDETNNTEPASGQKESGWTTNQVPPSSYFNWWQYLVYLWIQWFSTRPIVYNASDGFANPSSVGWAINAVGEVATTTPSALWYVPLNLPVGETVASIRFRVQPGGVASTITCGVIKYIDGSGAVVGSGAVSSATAAYEWVAPATGSFTVAAGEAYFATMSASGAGVFSRIVSIVEITPS